MPIVQWPIVHDPEYGLEIALTCTESDYELRTNAGKDGRETAYWIHDEWAEDPIVVMGAIFGALNGAEIEGYPHHPAREADR